eukprot:CAMPEP_0172729066 /NCGR_PEP_ID=MMETSP1074-20121228/93610_1 /TAXON_ID=2916 /ORGANISM="Ceratium fusus, Strain PA161109" /LENGTH=226 /DNA_ID=CAMNT_0013556449 /DNA_START=18 /DNA_END=696 /DNA_ORIENTATION=+
MAFPMFMGELVNLVCVLRILQVMEIKTPATGGPDGNDLTTSGNCTGTEEEVQGCKDGPNCNNNGNSNASSIGSQSKTVPESMLNSTPKTNLSKADLNDSNDTHTVWERIQGDVWEGMSKNQEGMPETHLQKQEDELRKNIQEGVWEDMSNNQEGLSKNQEGVREEIQEGVWEDMSKNQEGLSKNQEDVPKTHAQKQLEALRKKIQKGVWKDMSKNQEGMSKNQEGM